MTTTRSVKQSRQRHSQPGYQRRQGLVIALFLCASVSVALINVLCWPKTRANHAVLDGAPLYGTGLSQDVAALLSKQRKASDPIAAPGPAITPENADQFAGIQQDPVQRYSSGGHASGQGKPVSVRPSSSKKTTKDRKK